jgi:hypothetical protein
MWNTARNLPMPDSSLCPHVFHHELVSTLSNALYKRCVVVSGLVGLLHVPQRCESVAVSREIDQQATLHLSWHRARSPIFMHLSAPIIQTVCARCGLRDIQTAAGISCGRLERAHTPVEDPTSCSGFIVESRSGR